MAKRKIPAPAPEDVTTGAETDEKLLEIAQGLATDPESEQLFRSKKALENLRAAVNSFLNDSESIATMRKTLLDALIDTAPVLYLITDLYDMENVFWPELVKIDPDFAGPSFREFITRYTPVELWMLSQDPESPVSIALSAARAKAETATGTALPTVKYHPVEDDFLFLTDKLTREFFSQNARPGTINKDIAAGQLSFDLFHERGNSIPLKYEPTGAEEITLYYNYGEMQNFDAADYFVASALDALYFRGDTLVSLTKIWHEMGNDGKPSAAQLEDLEKRLIKGMTTPFIIDDKEVMQARGKDRYRQIITNVIDAAYMTERKMVNGKVAEGWIRINAPTMFSAVARDLNRIATWDRRVLSKYTGKRTSRYYTVLMFLLTQLSWMQHENSTRKNTLITYATLYKETGAKTSSDKKNTRAMFYRLLDEVFVPLGFVTKYKEQGKADPGVLLTLATDNTIASRKPKQLKRQTAKTKN